MRLLLLSLLFAACSTPEQPRVQSPPSPTPSQSALTPFVNPQLPAPSKGRYAASHILIAWKGATEAHATVTREEEAARRLATDIHQRLMNGEPFSALADNHSDDPSSQRGGALGVYFTWTMIPVFEAAVANVAPGQLGQLIKTPFGFHIVRRDSIIETRASHILISHRDAPKSANSRSRETAQALIWEAFRKVRHGAAFKETAKAYSDDSTAPENGGDLGLIGPGQMVPEFDETLFSLANGQVSEPFETPYGYHIVLRRR